MPMNSWIVGICKRIPLGGHSPLFSEFSQVLSSWLQWHRNFCLQRQCPLAEPWEMWGALWCGRIWVHAWPFFGLSGCRIALDMQNSESNWITMVEMWSPQVRQQERQVEYVRICWDLDETMTAKCRSTTHLFCWQALLWRAKYCLVAYIWHEPYLLVVEDSDTKTWLRIWTTEKNWPCNAPTHLQERYSSGTTPSYMSSEV